MLQESDNTWMKRRLSSQSLFFGPLRQRAEVFVKEKGVTWRLPVPGAGKGRSQNRSGWLGQGVMWAVTETGDLESIWHADPEPLGTSKEEHGRKAMVEGHDSTYSTQCYNVEFHVPRTFAEGFPSLQTQPLHTLALATLLKSYIHMQT